MSTTIYGARIHKDDITLHAQKGIKFGDSDSSNFAYLKAPATIATDFTLTLPVDDGTPSQALITDGSGVLSWSSFLSASLASGSLFIGVAGVATATDTAAQGDITASATGLNINAGAILNADINASAAIAYSKLNLSGSIVNADVNASAAIAYSKLNLSASVVNADIAAAAAIAYNKLAALTASRALASDGSGFVSVSAVTSTELGYVSGVTSAIQTQLNAKAAKFSATWLAATGTTKVVTHNLATKDVVVEIYNLDDDSTIQVDSIVRTDTNTVTLVASQAPAVSWRVVVHG